MQRTPFISLALIILTVSVYWPVKNHEFVNYDDPDYVTANPVVQKGFSSEGLNWAFQNVHGEKTYWHPLTWISHLIDVQLFGLNPAGHHLSNVLYHMLNVLLLFWVLFGMTGALWPSAMAAALFAVHPLQVDTVAWVTERKNLLSTLFILLGLLAYTHYAKGPSANRYARVFFLFCLALMSKPAVVTFPCLLLLLDFWPLRRIEFAASEVSSESEARAALITHPKIPLLRAGVEKLPLLFASAASCAITLLAHRGLGMIAEGERISLRLRLENAIVSYARYIKKIFWPNDLAVLYPHPGRWPLWEILLSGILLLVVTALVLRRVKYQPYLFTGWFWFLGMLVPAIGIVQVGEQAMADRFVYVPLIGILLILVWAGFDFAAGSSARRLLIICAGASVAGCIITTSLQLRYWTNSIALWEHTLHVTRNNFIAHHDLAQALAEKNQFKEAREHAEAALAIKDHPFSHVVLAHVSELEQNTNAAIVQLQAAVRLAPRWNPAREELARMLGHVGRTDEALSDYAEVLRLIPARPDIHLAMALLLASTNRIREAIEHYQSALDLNPNDLVALNNLAWIYSTHPNPSVRNGIEAMRLAERACSLTRATNPQFLATLAAANAECGNYQRATSIAKEAHTIAMTAANTNAAAQYEKLRAQVSSRQPYRDDGWR